jgi:O-antigen ligase
MAASIPVSGTPIHTRLKTFAIAALCFQAFFAMTDFGGQFKPEYGAFVATLLLPIAGRAAWRELVAQPLVWLLAAFILFLVLHAAYAATVLPSISYSKQLSAAAELVRLGVFSFVLGWWLSLMPRAVPYLFGLMILGLLTAVVAYMPWQGLAQVWDGRLRPRFGMPENLGGQLAAIAGWLALCLLLKLWNTRGHLRRHGVLMLICVLAYIGSFCALLFSQSRGAWLALAATLPAVLLGFWYTRRRSGDRAVPWPPLLAVAAVSLLLLIVGRDIVAQRFAGVERLLPDVVATDARPAPAAAPERPPAEPGASAPRGVEHAAEKATPPAGDANNKAVSVRMQLYDLGVKRWREHPWLGWGLRSMPALIARSGMDLGGDHYTHLHSAYLDALVGMGMVGAGLLGLLFILLLRELVLARRCGAVSNTTFWMLAGCVGIVLIANGFDSLLWRYDYARAPLEIVFGSCLAYGLVRRRKGLKPVRP